MNRWFGALALFAFGLRALVPSGFMFEMVDGHLRLTICPEVTFELSTLGTMPDMAGMAHNIAAVHSAAENDQVAPDSKGVRQGGSSSCLYPCPFALAGVAAPVAHSLALAAALFLVIQVPAPPAEHSVLLAAPMRYQAPRGPPTLA